MNDLNQTVDEPGRESGQPVPGKAAPTHIGRYRVERLLGQGGFGLVYLEAMGRGVPVVAGASGASLEIIDDGRSGFLVAPDDHRALSQRITKLLRDRHLQAAVGSAARARFVERFTMEQFAARLYPILGLEASTKEEAQTGTAA